MFHIIIPARFASTRLPGKPLLSIGEKPLIQWVWQSAVASGAASVKVATDDARIAKAVEAFGGHCILTSSDHVSGTDRLAEVISSGEYKSDDVVINLQGDEPLMPAPVIAQVAHT